MSRQVGFKIKKKKKKIKRTKKNPKSNQQQQKLGVIRSKLPLLIKGWDEVSAGATCSLALLRRSVMS